VVAVSLGMILAFAPSGAEQRPFRQLAKIMPFSKTKKNPPDCWHVFGIRAVRGGTTPLPSACQNRASNPPPFGLQPPKQTPCHSALARFLSRQESCQPPRDLGKNSPQGDLLGGGAALGAPLCPDSGDGGVKHACIDACYPLQSASSALNRCAIAINTSATPHKRAVTHRTQHAHQRHITRYRITRTRVAHAMQTPKAHGLRPAGGRRHGQNAAPA
jgi:hypothetical protein